MNGQTFHPKAALDLGRSTTRHTDYAGALDGLHRGPSKSTGYNQGPPQTTSGPPHAANGAFHTPQATQGFFLKLHRGPPQAPLGPSKPPGYSEGAVHRLQ